MRFTDFLSEDAIRPSLRSRSRQKVLRELAEVLATEAGAPAERIHPLLTARERIASTVICPGVAIPHCRLEGLQRITACVGIHHEGLAFGPPEGGLIHVFVGVVSPPDTGGLHLNVLSRIAALLHEPQLREALKGAPTAAALRTLLMEAEEAHVVSRSKSVSQAGRESSAPG